jgi:hypothetical protein
MTPQTAFVSVLIPADLAEAFESRAWKDSLCAEEALIDLLSNWVNDPESTAKAMDMPEAMHATADLSKVESAPRVSGLRYGDRLRRCRNCGLRVPKSLRMMPWKACSENCADELWIKANIANAELS